MARGALRGAWYAFGSGFPWMRFYLMNGRRWIGVVSLALLMLLLALPAMAQEATPEASPLAGLWSFLGITPDMLEANSGQAAATDDLGALLATLPQWRTEDGAFVVGEQDAPFTLIEFADFACPHCITYETDTIEPFLREYVATGQASFEFRPFPTAGGDATVAAAQLLECAELSQPGAFWAMYPVFYNMAESGAYSVETMFRVLTNQLGLAQADLIDCATNWDQNQEKPMQIMTDYELANSVGITGTPSVLVRFNGGEPEVLVWEGQTWNQGGVPLEILAEVVASVQPQ